MKLLMFAIAMFVSSAAFALDAQQLGHVPPGPFLSVPDAGVLLQLPARDYKRARVLVAYSAGYKIYEMSRKEQVFQANVKFHDLAVLKYQFQIETVNGTFEESDYFIIDQPASHVTEKESLMLSTELDQLSAKQAQLENALYSIRETDPQTLAKRKNQELARALVILSQKERELAMKKGAPQ